MMVPAGRVTATARGRHWCFKQPDFGSKGPGPAYRLLMTFGQADDLVYEFATNSIATPGRPTQRKRGGVYRDLLFVPYESAWRLESHYLLLAEDRRRERRCQDQTISLFFLARPSQSATRPSPYH